MNFDKTKSMRGAERFLAQGKIRLAIGEYEQVIKHDPKDIGTLNILGDLYIKTSSRERALECYHRVAEHYGNLGFAHKAIAVYNKIAKLEPNSLEVSAKLAELYKLKGSVLEARSHYVTLAEHYQKSGKRVEALAIWKQIALLDPSNTEVFLNIAGSYLEENQPDEACEAYVECGSRFAKQNRPAEALDCFAKALEIRPEDARALSGYVAAKFAGNAPGEAAEFLEELLLQQPFNREIIRQLIDCYLTAGDMPAAERAVIKLVEHEPANYPKFLDLATLYLEKNDLDATTRILAMSAEHMLIGGQASEFNAIVREVLSRDPDHLDGLRLLVRYCAWQKDEEGFRNALVRLAEIARDTGCFEDERYALTQLVMIMPHEIEYAERLREINEANGFANEEAAESLFDQQFFKPETPAAEPEDFQTVTDADIVADTELAHGDIAIVVETASDVPVVSDAEPAAEVEFVPPTAEIQLSKEIESIRFYVDSGYFELAEKAVNELRGEFGELPEIVELREYLESSMLAPADDAAAGIITGGFGLSDLRSELGIDESDPVDDGDYDTHYQTGVAYKEMGLVEQAIHEFQEAISSTTPDDGTRRFFQCANLLGHCFMEQGMPKLALKWFNRTLETPGLDAEEKQALWYEIAAAHEMDGDQENASRYFEFVYAENVDFRDVSERLKSFMLTH